MRSKVFALCFAVALMAQTPEFEVASVKPSPPIEPLKLMAGKMHLGMLVDAARVDIGGMSLAELIRTAYRVKPYQVIGPDWMKSERYDVMAKMPEGASKDQVPEMLQELLADRFKLKTHRDNKEHSVYALVVGKNGPKLKEAAPDPDPAVAPATPSSTGGMVVGQGETQVRIDPNKDGKGATIAGKQFGQMKVSVGEGGIMRMEFLKMNMSSLADLLSRMTDRPVVDMTELKGSYQLTLDLSMDEMRTMAMAAASSMGMPLPMGHGGGPGDGPRAAAPAEAASTPGGSSIFGAVQQLGLKLDPRKLPLETVVVDHLERSPTEN
jgi:uncharacterized protein (TIGR03435 family)